MKKLIVVLSLLIASLAVFTQEVMRLPSLTWEEYKKTQSAFYSENQNVSAHVLIEGGPVSHNDMWLPAVPDFDVEVAPNFKENVLMIHITFPLLSEYDEVARIMVVNDLPTEWLNLSNEEIIGECKLRAETFAQSSFIPNLVRTLRDFIGIRSIVNYVEYNKYQLESRSTDIIAELGVSPYSSHYKMLYLQQI